jgi:hypothetical protein
MLIGITGKKMQGKSTAASRLIHAHGFALHNFADPLKNMLKAIGLTDAQLYGAEKEIPIDRLGGLTPRHAMQTLGAEWGRDQMGAGFWVKTWTRTKPGGHIVADDVRFPNEAEAIKSLGGYIVRVIRPGMESEDSHASENADLNSYIDVDLLNFRDVPALRASVDNVVAAFSGDLPSFDGMQHRAAENFASE